MQPGFEPSYNLFTPQQAGISLRDLGGVPTGGWRPFIDSRHSPKTAVPHPPGEFYQHGPFTVAPTSGEALMVAPDEAWQVGKLVDDSSLRCLFPGAGVAQPRPGLSLSLFNKSADVRPAMAFHSQPLVQEGNFFPPPHHQLRSSRYLEPVQELLNELCSLGAGKNAGEPKRKAATGLREEGASSTSSSLWNQTLSSLDISELKRRYTQLVSMLEELDRRYRRYCEQMRAVVSGFEVAAGEGAAKVYSTLAMKAMSRHFRCLRDGIAEQMKEIKKATGDKDAVAPGASRGETPRLRLLDHHLRQQKAFQQSGAMEPHPWRPQRGLPERSVSVLRAWLFEHFLHPYPSDVDKHILARQTGLSRSQVCNWFINARVRLWKPMVEEMYLEETKEKLENQSSRGNMVQQGASQTGQSQNPNALGIQHLQLQDEQNSRPLQLGGSDEDSLSSVVNSSHNSDRGDPAMSGKNPLYGPPPRQYNPLQHLARPDHNFGLVDVDFSSYSECGSQQGFGNGVSLTLGLQQHNGGGVSLCFSPGSQNSLFFSKETPMEGCQPVQFSILEGDTQNPPYRNLMGGPQVLQDFQD